MAISSSALFDTRKEHYIYEKQGLEKYVEYQIKYENTPLPRGAAFPLAEAMLQLNNINKKDQKVEIVIISKNEPEAGLRIMNSIENYQLSISRTAFLGGESVAKYLSAYNVSLFLSKNEEDVRHAVEYGFAAGLLYDAPDDDNTELNQLRIAFDGDAVIFSDEAEIIFQKEGIEAFWEHEKANAEKPLPDGPFAPFLRMIAKIQRGYNITKESELLPIRTALVTARNSPAHKRVILTLRAWGVKINEMFFLGGVSKDEILKKFHPHIFFDDQEAHAKPASAFVPSARVPTKKLKLEDEDQDSFDFK